MKSLYESIISNSNIGRYTVGNKLNIDGYKCIVIYNDNKTVYLLSSPLIFDDKHFIQKSNGDHDIYSGTTIKKILEINKNALNEFKNGWHIPDNKDRKLLDSSKLQDALRKYSIYRTFWTLIKQSNTQMPLSIYYDVNYKLMGVTSEFEDAYIQLIKKIDL